MMGFCVNLITVDANFEMGSRWIFLLMVNFLLMVTNFTWTCFHLSQDYLCLIFNGRETEIERLCVCVCVCVCVCERGNSSLKKTSSGKSFNGFFWDFVTFSLWNIFLTTIICSWRKNLPAENFAQQTRFQKTLIYVKKSF